MKTCFSCGQCKPFSEFYAHPQMADGYVGKCKVCTRSDVAAYRAKNIDTIRAYDRDRNKRKDRLEQMGRIQKRNHAADPRPQRCRYQVAKALRNGTLIKHPCVRCGSPDSEAHHESYDHPLAVTWLCKLDHEKRHSEMAIEGKTP